MFSRTFLWVKHPSAHTGQCLYVLNKKNPKKTSENWGAAVVYEILCPVEVHFTSRNWFLLKSDVLIPVNKD